MNLGSRLKHILDERGLTVTQFSRKAGVPAQTIYALINRDSNVLVLDEPTNHLDVDAKDELKRALLAYKGSILMVCHEPEFYEGLATRVIDCTKWTTRLY